MTTFDPYQSPSPWTQPQPPQPPPTGPPVLPAPPPRPGVETRQVLLVLGAGCLVAAMAAGTALVWAALGPSGQAALMLAVTASLLVAATRLRRLPATADALGAVGVGALLIDAVAGRSLGVAGLRDLPLHVYAGCAATAVAVVLVALTRISGRLWAPPVGAAVAAVAATIAWVDPDGLDRLAWVGPATMAVLAGLDVVLRPAGRPALAGRVTAAALGVVTATVGLGAAIVAAALGSDGRWAGVLLAAGVFALPEATATAHRGLEQLSAVAGGSILAALLVAAEHGASANARVGLTAALAGIALLAVALPQLTRLADRARLCAVAASAPAALAFYASVSEAARPLAHVSLILAGMSATVAVCWPRVGPDARDVRAVAAVAAVMLATIGVDLLLSLRHVTMPEAFVAVPAFGAILLGAAAMAGSDSMPSWVLAPGMALGLLPTLHLALAGDVTRQAVVVGAGAALVVLGAQLRLAAPLAVGAAAVGLIAVRVLGPEVSRLPHWVALGVVGAVLLSLGATWEARLLDIRRAAHAVRPRIGALR
jgi:hypothetical protein